MKNHYVLCILFLFCSPIFAEEAKVDIPKYLQSISITINTGGGQGSGVIITRPVKKDKDTQAEQTNFVLTAAHVIANLRTVRSIIDGSGKTKKVIEFKNPKIVQTLIENGRTVGRLELDTKVIKFSDADNGEDLAILMVTKKDFIKDSTKFLLTEDIVPIGTKLLHVGSLLGQEGSNSMTTGIMSQVGRVLSLGSSTGVIFDQSTVTAFPGCLTSDSLVSMADGTYKKIIDIKINDKVICYGTQSGLSSPETKNGLRPVKTGNVSNIIESGVKEVFEIKTGNSTIKASGNHPFVKVHSFKNLAGEYINNLTWSRADELKEGDIVGTLKNHIPFKKSINFNFNNEIGQKPTQDKEDFMNLLGFYVGDGYKRYRISEGAEVSLYTFNPDLEQKYAKILQNLFNLKSSVIKSTGGNFIQTYNKDLVMKLSDWGFDGNAHTKRIPSWVFQIPTNLQLAFFKGYMEADGHEASNGHWQLECCNKELIEDFWMLAKHIGLTTSNIYYRERTSEINGREVSGSSWLCEIYPDDKSEAEILGNKENIPEDLSYERIRSIKSLGQEMTYDLTVDTYSNFFANGFLVHNSSGGGVFTEDGTHIGTLVRGAGETFNLIVPARRLNSFLKKNDMFWLVDPKEEVPLLSIINKIPIQDEAKDVEEHKSADAVEDEEIIKNNFPFLIK